MVQAGARDRWTILIGSMIGMIVGTGAIAKVTASLFLKPVTEAFGWSRGAFSAISLIASLAIIIMQPVFGWMMDRYGVRRAALPFVFLMATALFGFAAMPGSIAVFYGICLMLGLASAAQSPPLYARIVSLWFDRDRGLALAIATSGAALGNILVPLYAQFLIDNYGWRVAYAGIGVANLILVTAVIGLVLREPPRALRPAIVPQDGERTATGQATRRAMAPTMAGTSFRRAIAMPGFWLLAGIFLLLGAGLNGTIFHEVALLTDRGWTAAAAVALASASGLANVTGRFASGWILDNTKGPGWPALLILLPTVGCVLLASGWGSHVPAIAIMLLAFSYGADLDVMAYFTSRYFGLSHFGQIYGAMFSAFALGSGIGPIIMGRSFDVLASYRPALLLNAALLLVTFGLIWLLGPYKFPESSGDIKAG